MKFEDYLKWTTAIDRPNGYILREKNKLDTKMLTTKPVVFSSIKVLNHTCYQVSFGSHAPFKPNIPGCHMRHYHKPSLKSFNL